MKFIMMMLRWGLWLFFWLFLFMFLIGWWLGLRFTWYWWSISLIPVAVVWYFARQYGARMGRKRLLIGTTMLSACIVAVFRGYFVNTRPEVPEDTHPAVLEYSMGDDQYHVDGYYDLEYPTDTTYVLFFPADGDPLEIDLYFDEIRSVDSKWGIEDTEVTISCGDNTNCSVDEGTWRGSNRQVDWQWADLDGQDYAVKPYFKFDLPLSNENIHQRFDLTATARVLYADPEIRENNSVDVQRKITIFVGSPSEYQTRIAFNQWRALNNLMTDSPGLRGLTFMMAISGAMLLWGYALTFGFDYDGTWSPVRYAMNDLHLRPLFRVWLPRDKNPPKHGAYVAWVDKKTMFYAAGLEKGSVILEIDGFPIDTPRDVYRAMRELNDRQQIMFFVWQDGTTYELMVYFDTTARSKPKNA